MNTVDDGPRIQGLIDTAYAAGESLLIEDQQFTIRTPILVRVSSGEEIVFRGNDVTWDSEQPYQYHVGPFGHADLENPMQFQILNSVWRYIGTEPRYFVCSNQHQ